MPEATWMSVWLNPQPFFVCPSLPLSGRMDNECLVDCCVCGGETFSSPADMIAHVFDILVVMMS